MITTGPDHTPRPLATAWKHSRRRFWSLGYGVIILLAIFPSFSLPAKSDGSHATRLAAGIVERIPVVLDAVTCAADLVICADLDVLSTMFKDMHACDEHAAKVRKVLAVKFSEANGVIFVRCRYAPWIARAGRRTNSSLENPGN